jgi:hypothetical protein
MLWLQRREMPHILLLRETGGPSCSGDTRVAAFLFSK